MNMINEEYYGGSIGKFLNNVPVLPGYKIFSIDELYNACTDKEAKQVLQSYKKVFKDSQIVDNTLCVIKIAESSVAKDFENVYLELKKHKGINRLLEDYPNFEDMGREYIKDLKDSNGITHSFTYKSQMFIICLSETCLNSTANHEFNHMIQNMKIHIAYQIFQLNSDMITVAVEKKDFLQIAEKYKEKAGEIMGDDGSLFMEYAEYYKNDQMNERHQIVGVPELIKSNSFKKYIYTKDVSKVFTEEKLFNEIFYISKIAESEAWIRSGYIQFLNFFAINAIKINARDFRINLIKVIEHDVNYLNKHKFLTKLGFFDMNIEHIIQKTWKFPDIKELSRVESLLFSYASDIIDDERLINKSIDRFTLFDVLLALIVICTDKSAWNHVKRYIIAGK